MIDLKKIILQLDENIYQSLSSELNGNKAEKFHTLLQLYRENGHSDEEIIDILKTNINSFYTLKSRLFDKVQNYLIQGLDVAAPDLFSQAKYIPELIYNTNRKIAIATLKKLEKDLVDYDVPAQLTEVYSALKKLHINSPKYYHYSQLYNKHVAYTLALNKAEELLTTFNEKAGEYYLSRNSELLPILTLLKQEMTNLSNLYQSHHLTVYQYIINISSSLFAPLDRATSDDEPVEDALRKAEEIFKNYSNDISYSFIKNAFTYLSFEYYHQHELYKKEGQYFDALDTLMPNLLLYNHTVFIGKFLESKVERYVILQKEKELYCQSLELIDKYQPEEHDDQGKIFYYKFLASAAYLAKQYNEAASHLNTLLNEVSFKKYTHAEIEVKLLLAFCYILADRHEQAETVIRSVSRKIRESEDELGYENAKTFVKMLNLKSDSYKKGSEEKINKLFRKFEMLNKGPNALLRFIKPEAAAFALK